MINRSEALQECERMRKDTNRDVEVKATECDCDYSRNCGRCAGSGTFYELVYAFCDHVLKDDDRDEECWDSDCAVREKLAVAAVDPFAKLAEPMKSYREFVSEQVEEEAVA